MTLTEKAIKEYENKILMDKEKKEKELDYLRTLIGERFKSYTSEEKFEMVSKDFPILITCDNLNFEVNKLLEFYLVKKCEKCDTISKHRFNNLPTLGAAIEDNNCNSVTCRRNNTGFYDR